jgi:hypothetical protein
MKQQLNEIERMQQLAGIDNIKYGVYLKSKAGRGEKHKHAHPEHGYHFYSFSSKERAEREAARQNNYLSDYEKTKEGMLYHVQVDDGKSTPAQ